MRNPRKPREPRKPFKLSRLPTPKGPGDIPHMREPTIPELRELRARLRDHADTCGRDSGLIAQSGPGQ